MALPAPSSRLAARLCELPHHVLAEFTAALCSDSADRIQQAEAVLAAHTPVQQWAMDGVLLSCDLASRLLAPLEPEDGAAAAVCSVWAHGWQATNEGRRRLRPVDFNLPDDILRGRPHLVRVPGKAERLAVRMADATRFLDRAMRVVSEIHGEALYRYTADEDSILEFDGTLLRRLTHDGAVVATADDPLANKELSYPTAAGGLLFYCCSAWRMRTGS